MEQALENVKGLLSSSIQGVEIFQRMLEDFSAFREPGKVGMPIASDDAKAVEVGKHVIPISEKRRLSAIKGQVPVHFQFNNADDSAAISDRDCQL